MKPYLDPAEIFVAGGQLGQIALSPTSHLGISAHQDDLETMALSGILQCFLQVDKWLCDLVVTDGRGSPGQDPHKDSTDEGIRLVRREEHMKASIFYGSI